MARAQSKATPPAGVTKQDDFAGKLDSVLQQAEQLGAPVAAIQRAVAISRQPTFSKKDVFAVFDISQPSANKRFYLLDFTSGQVTAHFAAHGRQFRYVKSDTMTKPASKFAVNLNKASCKCTFLGAKLTSRGLVLMSANDLERTLPPSGAVP